MHDDTLLNKAARIERCVARAKAEYALNPDTFAQDFTRQDAAILNIQRACEAALDMGQQPRRAGATGAPQTPAPRLPPLPPALAAMVRFAQSPAAHPATRIP